MIVVLMGVSGSGKTTVGRLLARDLGWAFLDADDFHPPANVAKMRQGIALDDADRKPWLEALQAEIKGRLERGEPAVLACSALKRAYRQRLAAGDGVRLVYLRGDAMLIGQRLRERKGHYFDPALLASQFAALEEPEGVTVMDISAAPEEIARRIETELGLLRPF